MALGRLPVPSDDALLDDAATLGPANLRSLDAIHLATALSIRDEVGAFFTYDVRLAEAARSHGLKRGLPGVAAGLRVIRGNRPQNPSFGEMKS